MRKDIAARSWASTAKQAKPEIAIHAHVGVPDQLLDQLRTGVLDLYPTYAVYPEASEGRSDVREALRGLKEVVK